MKKNFKHFCSLFLILCLTLTLVQFPIDVKAATEDYTVYGEAKERAEDVFSYLDDFYTDQHPEAALRSRLSLESDIVFVKSLAQRITVDCTTDKEKADAIGHWISENIAYNTNGSAYIMDALYKKEGNCVSYAMLMEELLHQVGIPAIMGTGWRGDLEDMTKMGTDMFNRNGHAWCFVYLNGAWVLYDPLFNEYGISNIEYIERWYYLRTVDLVIPVYDAKDAPIGFHTYSDYEDMIYYLENRIVCLKKDGSVSDAGRLYVYENNYMVSYTCNRDIGEYKDGLYIEGNQQADAMMQIGDVYVDGWIIGDQGVLHSYSYENGSQPSCMVLERQGEPWILQSGGCYKLLSQKGQYRFQEGLFTVETGYKGQIVEIMSQELLDKFNARITSITSSDPNVISVKDGVLTAHKPGSAYIEYAVQVVGDTGYLMGAGIRINVVDDFYTFSLKDYKYDDETVTRVYGSSRYKTALGIAETMKEIMGIQKFDAVIIASGKNFPDALAGSYLAAKVNAPILMSDGVWNSDNTKELVEYVESNVIKEDVFFETNPAIDVYILGGTGAVPARLEEEFIARGCSVKRLSGSTRYDTNLEILKEAGVKNEQILVCTGENFADSLSASAAGLPILLVNPKENDLTIDQARFLETVNSQITIIGGEKAVSTEYEKFLRVFDSNGKVERIKGANRYETSVKVAEMVYDDKAPTGAVIAYAQNFPDGLCGGPLAYQMDAPLILTGPLMKNGKPVDSEYKLTTAAKGYISKESISQGIVLGGTGALTDTSVLNVFGLSSSDKIHNTKYQ